jgi:DNA-directed RNA polymerase specialized sigma24 family protein
MPAQRNDAFRQCLVSSLPRLQRFADVVAGDKADGRTLLRRALIRMLSDPARNKDDEPSAQWAFAEIYKLWREERPQETQGKRAAKGGYANFERLFHSGGGDIDALTVRFLWKLPVAERSALLLSYGERLDEERAATILGTTPEAIELLLVRAHAALADRLGTRSAARFDGPQSLRAGGEQGLL